MVGTMRREGDQVIFRFPYSKAANKELHAASGWRVRWDHERHGFVMPFAALLGAAENVRAMLAAFVIRHELDVDWDCQLALGLEVGVTTPPQREPLAVVIGLGRGWLSAHCSPDEWWGSELRKVVHPKDWVRLQALVLGRAGDCCEVCGRRAGASRLQVHEVWSFQWGNAPRVQRLERVVALCIDCRRTQHVHRARDAGELDLVVHTLTAVNHWSAERAKRDIERAEFECLFRRTTEWDLDLSVLDGLIAIDGYPTLYVPAADRRRLGDTN
ncbi:hypothetical protein [Actinomadura miaoliensis]|uniref:HNH endonuclease n=1 Tax=Actinomadura miaoliensis TaxID=430685 RepID=A0ABP7W4Z1_9ACTN